MSTVSHTGGVTLDGFLAAGITVASAASMFVAFRLGANWRIHKSLLIDDYVSIIAVGFLGAAVGLYYYTVAWLNDPTVPPLDLARVAIATYFVAAYSNYTAKAPLLLLYAKLFGAKVWVRRIAYITLALGFVGYTATSLVGTLDNPENKTLDTAYWNRLFGHSYGKAVSNAVFNLTIDMIAFLVPIPIIYRLHLPLRKKIGLAFLFVLGIVAISSGAVSLHFRRNSSQQTVEDLTLVCIFTILDSSIGIILGCVPAIRAIWIKKYLELGFFTWVKSMVSSRSTTVMEQTQNRKNLHAGDSQYTAKSHNYIELEEGIYGTVGNNIEAPRPSH
ncbi:hypothetical protein F4779DRAFT_111381 [Xylariaceae sp. FL0662B]|nr:hypothetical protein F4779DRAFT_111381 [Xylariaceae sp. FL0662B]